MGTRPQIEKHSAYNTETDDEPYHHLHITHHSWADQRCSITLWHRCSASCKSTSQTDQRSVQDGVRAVHRDRVLHPVQGGLRIPMGGAREQQGLGAHTWNLQEQSLR